LLVLVLVFGIPADIIKLSLKKITGLADKSRDLRFEFCCRAYATSRIQDDAQWLIVR
jgi:hypothetical protein